MNKYLVSLYRGYGYTLDSIEVEAYHAQEALEIAVVKGLGWAVEDTTALYYEIEEDIENGLIDHWHYIDLSEYGKPNVYVNLENARIKEVV